MKASATRSAVVPPPTSRKLAGAPPCSLHQVHGRHRQPGAVDHAADVAVQGDVVEVVLGGGRLARVFLADVAQLQQFRVPVQRVVVEVDLGIQREQVAAWRDHQRVDLDQAGVLLEEQLDQAEQDLLELLHLVAIEAQREAEAAHLVGLQHRPPGRSAW